MTNYPTLFLAATLVREASVMIEHADAMLIGFRHYCDKSRDSWPAEDGTQIAALRDALDVYAFYVANQVSVPVDGGLA